MATSFDPPAFMYCDLVLEENIYSIVYLADYFTEKKYMNYMHDCYKRERYLNVCNRILEPING